MISQLAIDEVAMVMVGDRIWKKACKVLQGKTGFSEQGEATPTARFPRCCTITASS
jgi:hypothetical protein